MPNMVRKLPIIREIFKEGLIMKRFNPMDKVETHSILLCLDCDDERAFLQNTMGVPDCT